MKNTMDEILSAWSGKLKILQEYLNIRRELEFHNKTDQDIVDYLRERKTRKSKRLKAVFEAVKCNKCNTFMNLEPINVDPLKRDRIGSPEHKSWWICPNDMITYYNTGTVREVLKGLSGVVDTKIRKE